MSHPGPSCYYLVLQNRLILELLRPGPEVIKLFSCSTQLIIKFQLLIKTKIPTNEKFLALNFLDVVFIMLINVKVPTIVCIFTFMSRINFVLSRVEHE